MNGWKTTLGGVSSILTGLAVFAKAYSDGTLDIHTMQTGMGFISAGIAAIGIGHKLDKATAAATPAEPKP